MPYTLQDVHIRQVKGGFIVRTNTVALDDQTAAPVGQRTDEEVCQSSFEAIKSAAFFLGVLIESPAFDTKPTAYDPFDDGDRSND